MDFVTELPRNTKTKVASSGRFNGELEPWVADCCSGCALVRLWRGLSTVSTLQCAAVYCSVSQRV